MKYKIFTFLMALVIGFTPVYAVSAQEEEGSTEPGTSETQSRKEIAQANVALKKAELTEARAAKIVERCERLQEKTTQFAGRVGTLKESRSNLIANVIRRMNNLADRLDAASVDTAELRLKITEFETLSADLDDLWQAYTTALSNLADTRCDGSAEDFHEALEVSKTVYNELKAKFHELRDFVKDELKPVIQDIRLELAQGEDKSDDDSSTLEDDEKPEDSEDDGSIESEQEQPETETDNSTDTNNTTGDNQSSEEEQ